MNITTAFILITIALVVITIACIIALKQLTTLEEKFKLAMVLLKEQQQILHEMDKELETKK